MGIMCIGRHDAKVIRTGLTDDSDNKTPSVVVQFENAAGDTISAYLFLSDRAWPFTQEKLETLGWDAVKQGYRFEEFNDDPSPVVGKFAEIVVDEETYEGKTRNKIKFINPIGGRIERMEPQKAQAFASRLRSRLLNASGAVQVPAGQRSQRPAGSQPDTDDIPF